MKLNTLRYLDRKIGITLCSLLYFFKKHFSSKNKHKFDKNKVKKILVIKIWGIGSIILASPLFKNLKEEFPEADIWFLTREGFQNIYPSIFFKKIETLKLKGFFLAIKDFINLAIKFRKEKFDLVIDLETASRYTALLSYLSGAKIKVGYEITGKNKDKLYDYTSVYRESKHITKTFLSALETLDIKPKKFPLTPPELSTGYDLSHKYIVVNINASELALERRMPLETQAEIIKHIKKNHSEYSVVLSGALNEKKYVDDFVENYDLKTDVINLAGQLSLQEFFYLIKNTELLISNDSGTAHIANSFNVRIVVFFGPETPVIYAPLGDKVKIFYSDTHCSPCISIYNDKKINCKNNQKCLKEFAINEINQAISNFL